MKSPQIFITLDSGEVWSVLASPIASIRAVYYNGVDIKNNPSWSDEQIAKNYQEIYEDGLENKDALVDWIQNNMNWEDIKDWFYVVQPPRLVSLEEKWNSMQEQNPEFVLKSL